MCTHDSSRRGHMVVTRNLCRATPVRRSVKDRTSPFTPMAENVVYQNVLQFIPGVFGSPHPRVPSAADDYLVGSPTPFSGGFNPYKPNGTQKFLAQCSASASPTSSVPPTWPQSVRSESPSASLPTLPPARTNLWTFRSLIPPQPSPRSLYQPTPRRSGVSFSC